MAAWYKALSAWAAGHRKKRPRDNVRVGQARKRAQVEASGAQYRPGRRPTEAGVVLFDDARSVGLA
jgi:hypothetical protein